MYKYFIVFLIGVLFSATIFLAMGAVPKTQDSQNKPVLETQENKQKNDSSFKIGLLGNSATIQTVFEALQKYLQKISDNTGVVFNYNSLTTNVTENEIKNALDYLMSEKVDLIVTGQSQAIILKSLNVKVPVIIAISSNPVEFGLAENERVSNNNFVFVEAGNLITAGERLRMYLEMAPKTKKVLVLRGDLTLPGESETAWRIMQVVAKKLDVELLDRTFKNRKELNDFMLNFNFSTVDAIFRYPGPFMSANIDVLFALEGKIHKPIISLNKDELNNGGIMSYSANYHELGEQAAVLVQRILIKQENPGQIPIIYNYKYDLGVNLKKLKEYNITLTPEFKKKVDYTVE
jgi:putative ABC transport system substrate-binding protein